MLLCGTQRKFKCDFCWSGGGCHFSYDLFFENATDCRVYTFRDIAIVAFSLFLKPSAAFFSCHWFSAADVAAGYVVYAPFTFIVKGLMHL